MALNGVVNCEECLKKIDETISVYPCWFKRRIILFHSILKYLLWSMKRKVNKIKKDGFGSGVAHSARLQSQNIKNPQEYSSWCTDVQSGGFQNQTNAEKNGTWSRSADVWSDDQKGKIGNRKITIREKTKYRPKTAPSPTRISKRHEDQEREIGTGEEIWRYVCTNGKRILKLS